MSLFATTSVTAASLDFPVHRPSSSFEQDSVALVCDKAREDLSSCSSLLEKENIVKEFLNTPGCDINLPIDSENGIRLLDVARIYKDGEFARLLMFQYGADPTRCNHETDQFCSEIKIKNYQDLLATTKELSKVFKTKLDVDNLLQQKLNLLVTEFAKYLLLESAGKHAELIKKEWLVWCSSFQLFDKTSERSMAVVGVGGRLSLASLRKSSLESDSDYQNRVKMCNLYELMANTIRPQLDDKNSEELLLWMQVVSGKLKL